MKIVWTHIWRRLSNHGMVVVLALLCAAFSALTIREHRPSDEPAAIALAEQIVQEYGPAPRVGIVVGLAAEDATFAGRLKEELTNRQARILASVKPAEIAEVLRKLE